MRYPVCKAVRAVSSFYCGSRLAHHTGRSSDGFNFLPPPPAMVRCEADFISDLVLVFSSAVVYAAYVRYAVLHGAAGLVPLTVYLYLLDELEDSPVCLRSFTLPFTYATAITTLRAWCVGVTPATPVYRRGLPLYEEACRDGAGAASTARHLASARAVFMIGHFAFSLLWFPALAGGDLDNTCGGQFLPSLPAATLDSGCYLPGGGVFSEDAA